MKEKETTKSFYHATIPSDWEMKTLGEIGEVHSGGTPNTTNEKFWSGNINWYTPTSRPHSKIY